MIDISSGGDRRRQWWRRALQISITILLTLFLPLSFLLLARLSAALHFLSFDIFLYFNSAVLYLLLSFLSVSAFLRRLTGGRVALIQILLFDDRCSRPRFSVGWLLLCTSVMFAELGIEFHLAGDDTASFSDYYRRSKSFGFGTLRGLLFAVGLYEAMMCWSESVVEPVVEDVVAAAEVKKRGRWVVVVERVGLGLSFGVLWWWRLRDHVDSLAVLPAAADMDRRGVMKLTDFVSLGLYYLTLSTGAVRAFTGVTGTMQLMIRRRRSKNAPAASAPAAAPFQDNV